MTNAFRSFLEKVGLVAPQKATAPSVPTAAPSSAGTPPMASTAAPEAPAVPAQQTMPSEEPAPAAPMECNSEHLDCMNDPKGCCELPQQHDGSQHQCKSCKQAF